MSNEELHSGFGSDPRHPVIEGTVEQTTDRPLSPYSPSTLSLLRSRQASTPAPQQYPGEQPRPFSDPDSADYGFAASMARIANSVVFTGEEAHRPGPAQAPGPMLETRIPESAAPERLAIDAAPHVGAVGLGGSNVSPPAGYQMRIDNV